MAGYTISHNSYCSEGEWEGELRCKAKGRGAIRADLGPKSEINFVAITI